jgi:integrase
MNGRRNPPIDFSGLTDDGPLTFDSIALTYLEDYVLQQYRTLNTARPRVEHLRAFFGGWPAERIQADAIRSYQLHRRKDGAASASINRGTSALSRMLQLAVRRGRLERMPFFPKRLQENPPRQGFFEHSEYVQVRTYLAPPFQDVLDFAYYSGWRRNEILFLSWGEVDMHGGVIRLSPERSKTQTGRVLPISGPLRNVLERRRALTPVGESRVFQRDGLPVRAWRYALRDACVQANVPHRMLHDCRRTAARNLVRAGVPERVAMLLTGHKTRAVFDRYNIVNEQELLQAGERLVSYLNGGVPPASPTMRVSRLRSA